MTLSLWWKHRCQRGRWTRWRRFGVSLRLSFTDGMQDPPAHCTESLGALSQLRSGQGRGGLPRLVISQDLTCCRLGIFHCYTSHEIKSTKLISKCILKQGLAVVVQKLNSKTNCFSMKYLWSVVVFKPNFNSGWKDCLGLCLGSFMCL